MGKTIFFSWQSDLPRNNNQNFIEKCINIAISEVKEKLPISLYLNLDRATDNVPGTPDIKETILRKINHSSVFICDITFITPMKARKKEPNSNVLFELGYALSILGSEKVMCLFNSDYGKVENLPFDIRNLRVLPYSITKNGKEAEQKRITGSISHMLRTLHAQGFLFNPLIDYQKKKIDRCILDISKHWSNLIFNTLSMTEGLGQVQRFLNLDRKVLSSTLQNVNFLGCFFYNVYPEQEKCLIQILEVLLVSSYYPRDWAVFTIKLLDWIEWKNGLTIKNYFPFPIHQVPSLDTEQSQEKLFLFPAHEMYKGNPQNSYLLLKKNETNDMIVMNSLNLNGDPECEPWLSYHMINPENPELLVNLIFKFIELSNEWLDITDSEFILDPRYYNLYPPGYKQNPQVHRI